MSDLWRKTLIYLGLVEEPEEHDEHELARHEREAGRATSDPDPEKVRALRPVDEGASHVRRVTGGPGPVTIVRPLGFDEAEHVGERYRLGHPVLLDLGQVDAGLARRFLDFVGGTIFALRGRIVPAGGRAFLLVPEGVEVQGDERRRLEDLGYRFEAPASTDAPTR